MTIVRPLPIGHPDRRGYLIAFEGIDGVGKTTQAGLLARYLADQGHDVVMTKEPNESPYADELRRLLSEGKRHDTVREIELFKLDREHHVQSLILPSLRRGAVVIVDRYYYSSVAYQGCRGTVTPEAIYRTMAEIAPQPDVTFIIELDVAESLKRITGHRGDIPNVFEKEENLRAVKGVFDGMEYEDICRINGIRAVEAVFEEVRDVTEGVMGKRG